MSLKQRDHLRDDQTYELLTEDPTETIVPNFNIYLDRCKEDKVIDA